MTTEKGFSKERRRGPRVEASFHVSYSVLNVEESPETSLTGTAKNVSKYGMCLRTDRILSPGHVVSVEFLLPGSENELLAVGKVIWSGQSPNGGFDIAVEFSWIEQLDEKAQKVLHDYIKNKTSEGTNNY